jgi:hypothetical protein
LPCYTEKRARLDALSQKIAAEQAWISHLLAELQGIGTVLFGAVLPELGIIGLAGLALWALFGWTLPAFWPIVLSLIAVIIQLVMLIVKAVWIRLQIVMARRRILRLALTYYRIQSIPTCRLAAQAAPTWWEQFIEWLEAHEPVHQQPGPK